MISIPIWLFVIFVIVLGGGFLLVIATLISYVFYCKYRDNRTRKVIEERYGTSKKNK